MRPKKFKIKKYYKITLLIITIFCLLFAYKDFSGPLKGKINLIVVNKSKREMLVYDDKKHLLKTYAISLGFTPKGKKELEGDGKTPEGIYYINDKNPKSIAHKNLGISYPNKEDMNNAKRVKKSPGGSIKIHGLMNNWWFIGKLHRYSDWTNGCIAVNNSEIDELYKNVTIGTKIIINP